MHGEVCIGDAVNWDSNLNRGLVSWWMPLPDQQRGNVFRNLCMRNHGTNTNGATPVGAIGRPGGFGAISLDGIDDYTNCGTSLRLTGELAICAWIRPATVAIGTRVIIGRANSAINASDYVLEINRFAAKISTVWDNSVILTAATSLSVNVWHHVAMVRSGSTGSWTCTLYLNGRADGSAASAMNPDAGVSPITAIGRPGDGNSRYFSGLIDDVRIHSCAPSDSEVLSLYKDSRQGYPDTLNWHRRVTVFDMGGGSVASRLLNLRRRAAA